MDIYYYYGRHALGNKKRRHMADINLLVPLFLMSNYLYIYGPTLEPPLDTVLTDAEYDKLCVALLNNWDRITHHHKKLINKDALVTATGAYLQDRFPEIVKRAAIAWAEKGLTARHVELLSEVNEMKNESEYIYVLTPFDLESVVTAKVILHYSKGTHLSISRKRSDLPYASTVYLIKPYMDVATVQQLCKEHAVTIISYTDIDLYKHAEDLDCNKIWIEREPDGKCLFEIMYDLYRKETPDTIFSSERPKDENHYPTFFEYVRELTKWTIKSDETLPFKYGVSTLGVVFRNQDVYDVLIADDKGTLNDIINKGKEIHDYLADYNKALIRMLAVAGKLKKGEEHMVAANASSDSLLFNSIVPDKINADLISTFHTIPFKHTVSFSLYRVNPDISIKEIAKRYDGGGYDNAGNIMLKDTWPADFEFEQGDIELHYPKELFEDRYTETVDRFIRETMIPRKYALTYGSFEGKNAVFCNTPFLPPFNFFTISHKVTSVDYCVCWFMLANGKIAECYRRKDDAPIDGAKPIGGGWYGRVLDTTFHEYCKSK